MAAFMDVVKNRRAVRKYEKKDIPEELLNQILEAVQWAPSWANTQVWEIIIVKDREVKEKLSETLSPKNPSTKAIANAPVVFAMCGKLKTAGFFKDQAVTKLGDWFMYDLGLASQNLCLTAHHLGLATVIVGAFDMGKVEEILGIPDGFGAVSLIPLGYPAQHVKPPNRREIKDFVHFDQF
jgi:nitroreductase